VRGPIVVGANGSDLSRLAIEEATVIAKGTGLSLVVAFVRHLPLAGLGAIATSGMSVAVANEILDAEQAIVEAESIAIVGSTSVRWSLEVCTGEPATELMRIARELDADTIVVAGKRHGAIGGYLCSSVCTQLHHRWPWSLLVIHPRFEVSSWPTAGTVAP